MRVIVQWAGIANKQTNKHVTLVLNFVEVQRAKLIKSTLLATKLVPLGSFLAVLRSV